MKERAGAEVTQLAEYLPSKQDVEGSTPFFRSIQTQSLQGFWVKEPLVNNSSQNHQNRVKTGQLESKVESRTGWIRLKEAAILLDISLPTIRQWCETGKLLAQAIPYGNKTRWEIHPQALSLLQEQQRQLALIANPQNVESHAPYVKGWIQAMRAGLIGGRPFSEVTITDYRYYVGLYLGRSALVRLDNLKAHLATIPPSQFSKRDHLFKALVCFGKYLIAERRLEPSFLEQAKPYKPKRHLPVGRYTVSEEDLALVYQQCIDLSDRVAVQLLAQTGIRASEACSIQLDHIDLVAGTLLIPLGKGGKSRRLGLPRSLCDMLERYIEAHQPVQCLLVDRYGKPMKRSGLYQRLDRIGEQAKVKLTCHSLRRYFVTSNMLKGRSLTIIQVACGHSKPTITASYINPQERQVVEAMQGWD